MLSKSFLLTMRLFKVNCGKSRKVEKAEKKQKIWKNFMAPISPFYDTRVKYIQVSLLLSNKINAIQYEKMIWDITNATLFRRYNCHEVTHCILPLCIFLSIIEAEMFYRRIGNHNVDSWFGPNDFSKWSISKTPEHTHSNFLPRANH